MSISASQVKELREKTGAGMMDAKNALVEADGDMEKAGELLRQKGIATADKKSGRTAAEGLVVAKISADRKTGVLVEVNCETDFVAKGADFQAMTDEVATQVLEGGAKDVGTLLSQNSLALPGKTVQDFVTDRIATIKENLTVRRFVRYEAKSGAVHSYIHTGGKIGVLIEVKAGNEATVQKEGFQHLLKDLAMQSASAAPDFVTGRDSQEDRRRPRHQVVGPALPD